MAQKFTPQIGKNVIETLTSGMYDDARFIFREYVQNAADQIDVAVENEILRRKSDGRILITINKESKTISVEDNATGIPAKSVLQFLGDVANSEKDSAKRKGFRGIGRLGGLGYCDKLIFETSYFGEKVKSIMSLDAAQLKKIILDRNINMDASMVISVITTFDSLPEESDKHYFKVILQNVPTGKLLNEVSVGEYLSMVAPLPFHEEFSYGNEIKNYYKKNNVIFDEYDVRLNGKRLFKCYKNYLTDKEHHSPVIGIDFFEVRDGESDLIALGWFGFRDISNKVLSQANIERGIRLRKNNIGIGDENTLNRFYKVERTNLRFIGEVHALSESLIPNGRRDYFNENKTCQELEAKLSTIFETEDWENRLAQNASKLHNRLKEIEQYKTFKTEFESQKGKFSSAAEEQANLARLNVAKDTAIQAQRVIRNISSLAQTDSNIKKLYQHIVADKDITVDPNIKNVNLKSTYPAPTFSKLSTSEAGVVVEIFNLIDETLSFKDADLLKKKILERYN